MSIRTSKSFLACLILALYLSACTAVPSQTPVLSTPTGALISPTSPTIIPSLTITPTPLAIAIPFHPTVTGTPTSTPTTTPTATPTVPPEARMQFHCLDIATSLSPNMVTQGSLVIREYGEGQRLVYLWNLVTSERVALSGLEDQFPSDMTVSPNGQWLAYSIIIKGDQAGNTSNWVVVVDPAGQQVATVGRNDWSEVSRWLDNERMIVKHSLDPISGLTVLNPFTEEQQDLITDFPGLNPFQIRGWRQLSEIVYDPTLTRVVYPRLTNDGFDIVLEDLTHREILTRIAPIAAEISVPIWSQDGSRFVIANTLGDERTEIYPVYELFSVSRDGEITQLTNLGAYYYREYITYYNWSPDGRFIVFSLEAWPRGYQNLPPPTLDIRFSEPDIPHTTTWAVLDTETQEVTNYCIEPYIQLFTGPFWSPDGSQFVVEVAVPDNQQHSRLVLVDIANEYAVQIADDVIPYGWMVAP